MKRTLAVFGLIGIAALGSAAMALTGGKSSAVEVASLGETAAGIENSNAAAGATRALDWNDLAPEMSSAAQSAAMELNLRIDQMSNDEIAEAMATIQSGGNDLVMELDDTDVSIEGYLVPLDFESEEVSEFVLVPYFGACIHVPPPPANQIVYVKFREALAMSEFETQMYSPFKVKGRIKASPAKTNLADVGYQMTASDIEQGQIQ